MGLHGNGPSGEVGTRGSRGKMISQGSVEEEKIFEKMTGMERGCVTGRNKAKVGVGFGGAGFGAGGFGCSTPKVMLSQSSADEKGLKLDSSGEAEESPKSRIR